MGGLPDYPGRYVSVPVRVEAMQWQPGDLLQAGMMIDWLMVWNNLPISHPSGIGDTTTLLIGVGDYEPLEPGGWVVRRAGMFFTLDDEVFRSMYEKEPLG